MRPSPPLGSRLRALGLATLLLVGCDDPAELAREVVDAQGDCSQDSLRVSSDTCVQMFERYAEMATDAIHTYIGGMKAMDQALQRLPPANFDTAGLGHAIRLPRDGAGAAAFEARASELPDRTRRSLGAPNEYGGYESEAADPAGRWEEPYGPSDPRGTGYADPGDWQRDPRRPRPYDPRLGVDDERAGAGPPQRPGVLLAPGDRLSRPWIGDDDPRRDPRQRWEDSRPGYDRPTQPLRGGEWDREEQEGREREREEWEREQLEREQWERTRR